MKRSVLQCLLLFFTAPLFSQVVDSSIQIFPFVSRINGKVGYANRQDKIIVEPQFASGTADYEGRSGLHTVSMDKKTYGLINSSGRMLIDFSHGYSWVSAINPFLIMVKKDDKYGFVDTNHVFVAPMIYDYANTLLPNNPLICLVKDSLYGMMNLTGEIIIPVIYENLGDFEDENRQPTEYTYAAKNGKYGFIEKVSLGKCNNKQNNC